MTLNKEQNLLNIKIQTDRLSLLPIEMKYVPDIFREFTSEITTYMSPTPPANISETEDFITSSAEGLKSGNNLQLVILDRETQEFLGCAGLHEVDGDHPEMGVWLKKSAHGKGFGREAMTAIKKWADENLDYKYILYPVVAKNIPSRKIPESLGGTIAREYDEKIQGGNLHHFVEFRILPDRG